MWILGMLATFGLYWLLVVWYLPLSSKNRGYQPYYWSRLWYHAAILVSAGLLLLLSIYLCARSSPWLTPIPFLIVVGGIILQRQQRGRMLSRVIRTAALLDGRLSQEGKPRSVINREIITQLMGAAPSESWVGADWDLASVLKFYVLPELGLYHVDWDLARMNKPGAVMLGAQIDSLIDHWKGRQSASKKNRRSASTA